MWLLKTLLPIVAFSFPTQSKIVGCDDVKCPTEGHPSGTIACSNANDGVGVASIESKVSDDGPLTWTVRGETISRPNGSSGWISYRKTFHLATPPSLDLNNGSFHGCSFLFSGITTVLQIDDGFHGWSKFECDTVMGDSCTKDMVTQIKTNLTSLLNTKPKLSELTLCGGLREFMEQAPLPDSCGAEGRLRRWGPIAEKSTPFPKVDSHGSTYAADNLQILLESTLS